MQGELSRTEILDPRQFEVAIRRLATSVGYGAERSPYLGSGLEYAQSRVYQPGDPVRSIDWKLTARTGIPYVKEYESPKRMPTWIVLDTSASMTIQTSASSKYETSVLIAGGVALASLERISPVGVLGVGDRPLRIRPTLSRDRVMGWLHLLRTYRYDERTSLGRRLAPFASGLAERCLLVVLSDLQDAAAMPLLKRLAAEHEVIVLQPRDPAERGISGLGFVRTRDAESDRTVIGRRFETLPIPEQELRRAGIDHLILDVDQPYRARLRQFLIRRGGLTRGAR